METKPTKGLSPEDEKNLRQMRFNRDREIESRLIDARQLYPEFDRHCKEHDFDEIILLWQKLLAGYTDFEITDGFYDFFCTSGEFITPAGVIRCIKGTYKN